MPQALVIEHNCQHRQVVPDHSVEFLDVETHRAVARDADHPLVRVRNLTAHGKRHAYAQTAQVAMAGELAWLACTGCQFGPLRGLTAVSTDDRVFGQGIHDFL